MNKVQQIIFPHLSVFNAFLLLGGDVVNLPVSVTSHGHGLPFN